MNSIGSRTRGTLIDSKLLIEFMKKHIADSPAVVNTAWAGKFLELIDMIENPEFEKRYLSHLEVQET